MFFCFFFITMYLVLIFLFTLSFFHGGIFVDLFLFSMSSIDISLSFMLDHVSLGFFSCVSFISGLVFIYSIFYMEGTIELRRFFWLIFGFVLSMFILVFSGNFFLVMVGWDGLGLTSFCLVVFYQNHKSLESGLVTVFSNRIGDVFFLLCFFFFFLSGAFFFDSGSSKNWVTFFCILFLGAITKSAQIPFSAWLPAAMAAPTPVSSLVHSSTLVTAGVYVMIRFSYIFYIFSWIGLKLFFIMTMLTAGACANLEKDFKKVVAMSTLSQLGMMLFILSVGVWTLAFLHMVIHAFFKSMLFLSTGSLMSQMMGSQDSRLYSSNSFSFGASLYFMVSCVCLSGFPFYIGFYSKDFILLSSSLNLGTMMYVMFITGCLFTVLYSLRMFTLAYSSFYKSFFFNSNKESFIFLMPIAMLFFKGWCLGGVFYWTFLSDGVIFWSFFDVLMGLTLLALGVTTYKKLKFSFNISHYLSFISFMQWFSSSSSSFLMSMKNWHKWDSSWMELSGGQGVYQTLNKFSILINMYKYLGLGMIFLIFTLVFSLMF